MASPFLQTTDENFLMGLNTTEGEESLRGLTPEDATPSFGVQRTVSADL